MKNTLKECAFCSHEGKLSAEHITGVWLRELFPGKKIASYSTTKGTEDRTYPFEELDWKAKVVCQKCNETWMSDIENQHAQPVLTPLITGQMDIPIRLPEARSIALYAFKTAVVIDHAYSRSREPFFDRTLRHNFGVNQTIPVGVQMWLCAYAGNRKNGRFVTRHFEGQIPPGNHFQMYVCTFALGHIAIQVVSANLVGNVNLTPKPSFESLAVPFWPDPYPGYVWPGSHALLSRDDFISFAHRWQSIDVEYFI